MNKSETFGIIVNDDHQFGVWPAHRKLPLGWRFTGPTGTELQMQEVLRQQFVETIPAPLITLGKRVAA